MKAIVISDVHLHDFRSYNLFGDTRFRLNQYIKLAHRISDIAIKNGVKVLFIAGDFLHVASPRPYIVNVAREFLRIVTEQLDVYVIAGQHDLDTRLVQKSNAKSINENTYLTLLNEMERVHYVHKQVITLSNDRGSATIAFNSWEPEFDFSWIKTDYNLDHVDYFVGHATITGSSMANGIRIDSGQHIDTSWFDIGFFGDIHQPQEILDKSTGSKIVIPNVPIPTNLGDSQDCSIIVADLINKTYERIPTSVPGCEFLYFSRMDDRSGSEYQVVRLPNSAKVEDKVTIKKSIDVNKVISDAIEVRGLGDIHSEIFNSLKMIDVDPINMDFKITKVHIKGFKSIEELIFTPEQGITLLQGNIGAGKSTLITAIKYSLTDDDDHRGYTSVNPICQGKMSVETTIEYNGLTHRICKGFNGGGFTKYWVNDVPVESENQKALKSRISADLKFTKLFNLLYFYQDRSGFLSSFSYNERVNLIVSILELNIIDKLLAAAKDKSKAVNVEITSYINTKNSLREFVHLNESVSGIDTDIDFDKEIATKQEQLVLVDKLIESIRALNYSKTELDSVNNNIKILSDSLSSSDELSITEESLSDKINKSTKILDNLKVLRKSKSDQSSLLLSQLNSAKSQIRQYSDDISSRMRELATVESDKSKLNGDVSTCYVCSSIVTSDNKIKLLANLETKSQDIKDKIESNKAKIKDINLESLEVSTEQERSSLQIDIERLDSSIESTTSNIQSARDTLSRINKIRETQSKIDSLISTADSISNKITDQSKVVSDNRTSILELSSDYTYDVDSEHSSLSQLRDNLNSLISKYTSDKQHHLRMIDIVNKVKETKTKLASLEVQISETQSRLDKVDKYCELMSPKGIILNTILNELGSMLTTDKIRVRSVKKLAGGDLRPDFDADMMVGNSYIKYDSLSGGQRAVVDAHILTKLLSIVGRVGILIFDETFKFLNDETTDQVVSSLRDIECNHIFIISHMINFPYSDQTVTVRQDSNGISHYSIH